MWLGWIYLWRYHKHERWSTCTNFTPHNRLSDENYYEFRKIWVSTDESFRFLVCFRSTGYSPLFHYHFSKPTHEDDPVSGFQPIENGTIHFLDINNEGLIPGLDPNKYVRHLWARIESFNNEFDELQRNLWGMHLGSLLSLTCWINDRKYVRIYATIIFMVLLFINVLSVHLIPILFYGDSLSQINLLI